MTVIETEAPPAEALELRESTFALPEGAVEMPGFMQEAYSSAQRDKMVPLHIIRPGVGKGRGNHLYEAEMLKENAEVFKGWKMYVDHLSPEARKASGGLPRSFRDIGGRIAESYWDPNVPADESRGWGQGAVIGWSIPSPFVREVIENDPEVAEASISANATGVRKATRNGKTVWLVEGIHPRGSVDWVTEAGAGGRVVALMEAAYAGVEDEEMDLTEKNDQDFLDWVQENRPHLLESIEEDTPTAASQQEETTMGEITPEALQEALQGEDFKSVVDDIVHERLRPLVEAAVADERELIRAEARADADRQIELRDLRDAAAKQVEESKLPDPLKDQVRERFALTENGPTPELDAITDEVDDDGTVSEYASKRLAEAVETAIQGQRELLGKINPTRVRGQGPATPVKDGEAEPESKKSEGTLWGSMLSEAGVDPEAAYSDKL